MTSIEPKILYKFRDWSNSLHQLSLLANAAYFASLSDLNDPLEGMNHPHYELLTDSELSEVYKQHLSRDNPELSMDEVNRRAKWWVENSPIRDSSQRETAYKRMQETLFEHFGVFCLSTDVLISSLWSYYAANHEGFAVGYGVKEMQEYFERLYDSDGLLIDHSPVVYVDRFEPWHPHTVRDEHWAKRQLCTKLRSWSHEREIRYISMQKTRFQIAVPNECIVEVVFGLKTTSAVKSAITTVLGQRLLHPRLRQVILASDNSGIEISELTS